MASGGLGQPTPDRSGRRGRLGTQGVQADANFNSTRASFDSSSPRSCLPRPVPLAGGAGAPHHRHPKSAAASYGEELPSASCRHHPAQQLAAAAASCCRADREELRVRPSADRSTGRSA
ncbi:unnamed protein product [Urochloa humidicola]